MLTLIDRHVSDLKTDKCCHDCGTALYKGLNWCPSNDDINRIGEDVRTVHLCDRCADKREAKTRTIVMMLFPFILAASPFLLVLYIALVFVSKFTRE